MATPSTTPPATAEETRLRAAIAVLKQDRDDLRNSVNEKITQMTQMNQTIRDKNAEILRLQTQGVGIPPGNLVGPADDIEDVCRDMEDMKIRLDNVRPQA